MREELRDGLLEREGMDRHAFVSREVDEQNVEATERCEGGEKTQEQAYPRRSSCVTREAMKVTQTLHRPTPGIALFSEPASDILLNGEQKSIPTVSGYRRA